MKITGKRDPHPPKAKARAQAQFSRLLQIATAQSARNQGAEILQRSAYELMHELEMHQAKLEKQNEELRRAQVELEKSNDRYMDLYDFAPIGYLAVSHDGMIGEANLACAALLGVERGKLLHRHFAPFVAPEDSDRWHAHFLSVLRSNNKLSCELALLRGDGSRFFALLSMMKTDDSTGCCGFEKSPRPRLKKNGNKSVVRIAIADITGRMQVELELQKFKNLVEFSDDAIISKTPAGIIESWNRGAEKMFGYTAQEAIGKPMQMLIPPGRLEQESEIMSRILRGERVEPFETVLQCKKGRLLDVSTTISPICDIQGRVLGISVIARDITGRKKAEAARQEALDLLRRIADQVPGVVFQLRMRPDGTSCVPYANDALREIYRISPEDVREDACKAFAHIHPEDLEKHMASIHASARDMAPWQQEFRLKFDDGTVRWLYGNALPQREADGSMLWHGFITDITERKRNENALLESEAFGHSVFNSRVEHVAVLDKQGFILAVNEAWLRFALENGAPELIGKSIGLNYLDICARAFINDHMEEAAEAQAGISAVLTGVQKEFNLEYACHSPDKQRWFHMRVTPLLSPKGGAVVAHDDITERKLLEQALQYSEAIFHELFENMSSAVAVYKAVDNGEDFVIHGFNRSAELAENVKRGQIAGKRITEAFPGVKEFGLFAVLQRVWRTGQPEHFPLTLYKDNRMAGWRENYVYRLPTGEVVAMYDDVTERKRAEEALRIAAITFESQEAIMITDVDSNIIRVNHAFSAITGYSQEEVMGKNPRIMKSERHDRVFYETMWQQLMRTGSWAGEIWDKRKNGEVYPKWLNITAVKNERNETTQYVAIFSDITERKKAEEEIRKLAFYDALTKLPNRRLLLDRLRAALLHSSRNGNYGAILFIDLDRFKTLNDTLGHDSGDLLLIEVASRIKSCVREMDTVARFGGDEFVVLIEDVSDDKDDASYKVGLVAEKIRESLAHPYKLAEHVHHSSPSIGVSLYHGNEEPMDMLLQHADMAMYQAKNAGRNAVRFFDIAMQQNVSAHTELVNDLRRAIERQQLHLYYQIQVDNENHPVGAEALLRWIHPQRGLVMPDQFIPVAEESTLIHDIGDWVLETACQQLALWGKDEKLRDLALAVNISAKQLAMPDFVRKVADLLKNHQINPPRLKLELTESMVLDNQAGTIEKMHALKALGVSLSMDGFGTRYSSLSYLKQLPIDQLKIDHDFVQAITRRCDDAQLVESIIDLANNFSLNVIAEGVETDEQLTLLKHRDCIAYQGFLFSRAVSIGEFEALMGEAREHQPALGLH